MYTKWRENKNKLFYSFDVIKLIITPLYISKAISSLVVINLSP